MASNYKEEVEAHSPILAGRLAVCSDGGIEKIVEEIRRSIAAAQRTREVTVSAAGKSALLAASRAAIDNENEDRFLYSDAGIKAVTEAADAAVDLVQESIIEISRETESSKYGTSRRAKGAILVHGPAFISLSSELENMYVNSARDCSFRFCIFRRPSDFKGETENQIIEEFEWKPRYSSSAEIRWQRTGTKERRSKDEMVSELLEAFGAAIMSALDKED